MKIITTTLLTALLLTSSQVALADNPFNRPIINPRIANIPIINPNHLAQLRKPDLIVSDIQSIGRARVMANNSIQVTISLVIKNVGVKTAGRFKLSVDKIKNGRRLVIPFRGVGGSKWYPMTQVNMRAGGNRHLSGTLTFRSSERGKTVFVKAKVDSCSGEEFTRPYCRINESNENNNESRLLRIRLP